MPMSQGHCEESAIAYAVPHGTSQLGYKEHHVIPVSQPDNPSEWPNDLLQKVDSWISP